MMSNSIQNKGASNSAEGDDDTFRSSSNEEREADANGTKSVSWTSRTSNRGVMEEALKMKSISVGTLPTSASTDVDRLTNDAEMSFSDEKDGDQKELLTDNRNGGGRKGTLGEEKEGDNDLPFDSFSMLFCAESPLEHCLPLLVFGLQMLILVLIMINLLQTSDRPLVTTMNVPVDVPMTVRISQYVACMVSVFTADDLVSGALNVGRRVVKRGHMDTERERLLGTGVRRAAAQMHELMRSISEADRLSKRHWKWELAK